jgi:PST family polysaccharide transporter
MNASWFKYLPKFIRIKLEHRRELQSAIVNSVWLLADKILRMGVGLLVGVWIARYLGPEQFGMWNYSTAFAALFSALATLGLDGIVVRELIKNPKRQNALLGSAFVLKLVGGSLALLISVIAILLLHSNESITIWLVGISAAGFIFQSVSVVDCYFQAKVLSRFSVVAANTAFLLVTGMKVVLLLISGPLIAFALLGLCEVALTGLFLLAAYRTNHLEMREWHCDRSLMLELLRESWPLILAGLAVALYMRIDMVMLQEMVGDHEVGIYAAATRLSEIWYFLPVVIVSSVSPSMIKLRENNFILYINRLRKLYFLMAWLAIGVSLPISLLSNDVINILYGDGYKESALVLRIHLWASIAVFLGVASSQYLLIEKLTNISFYRTLIGLICNVLLNMFFIPIMGAVGAAIATVISYFVATFSLIFFKATRSHAIFLMTANFGSR